LGTQDNTNFAGALGYVVAKLEAGNTLATDLEEVNRTQSLLIEELQNSVAESLVTLSEVQSLLDECCPEPTTTTSTTTIAPTTTTTSTTAPTTTTTPSSTFWIGKFSDTGNAYEVCFVGSWNSANVYTTVSSGPFAPNTPLYANTTLTTLWPINGVMSINNVVYTIVNGYTVGNGQPCSSTTTSTTTNMINPTLYSHIMDNPVGTALYNIDGPEAGKYWTIAYDYSQYTHIPNGQFLGVGTTIYMDQQCTQQWTFPLKYLIANVPDQFNINPYTWIWKVENGVITDNIGQFVNTARYLLHSTKVRNELLPCSEFYPNGITLDTGHTSLMPGVSVYSSSVDTNQPIPLNYTYLTDNVNVYTVSNGVITSSQPCSGITTSTTTIL
jgi:hypothetical protein